MRSRSRGVLFVCLGNICRSPLAEAVFLHRVAAAGLADRYHADSCGIGGWHAGEPADPRAIAAGLARGVNVTSIARRIDPATDFERFGLIVPMDRSNRRALAGLGAPMRRVRLMRAFDPALAGRPDLEPEVPDPYTGGPEDFDAVFTMLWAACGGLIDHLERAGPES